ncbi:MAG: glycosyltransferase [Planctomycetota bacterium]
MTIRVGIDATELSPGAIGGVATGVRLLLSALRDHAKDIDVRAVAPRAVEVPAGVTLHLTGGPRRPFFWRSSGSLRRALSEFDLFHSPVTAIPLQEKVPMTATVHELPFTVDERLEGVWRGQKQWYWLERALAYSRAIVAPTECTRRQILVAHPAADSRIRVAPHATPPVTLGKRVLHDGSLLFVGRLDEKKGLRALLRGARGFEGTIRLVGPQTERGRRQIERQAQEVGLMEQIEFMGVVEPSLLDEFYRRARAVVLLSASEGFGFPVLEGLSRGTPVLVARDTGAAEVGGDAALVVNPREPDEIAAAIETTRDQDYRRATAEAGPRRAAEFTAEKTAAAYQKIFLDAVAL